MHVKDIGIEQSDTNCEKTITRLGTGTTLGETRMGSKNKPPCRRMLVRPSGLRDYWILESKRKAPVYNEAILSKPQHQGLN
ncbi:hypothetical protein TWF506_004531 [Arthrobotrys conoides]|uniref:Uncharacterized protein n=1 Tax=Arthrobotrys conoides TaxID=74498 RepID=A0AAN8RHX3_9PEZI